MHASTPHNTSTHHVTLHAVIRYVQRVLGVTVPGTEAEIGAQMAAHRHSDAVGMTVDEVKAMILCPEICRAIDLGAHAIRTPLFKAVLSPSQRLVITIKFSAHTPGFLAPKRYSEPTRSETRRLAHQFSRRGRAKHKRHQPHE